MPPSRAAPRSNSDTTDFPVMPSSGEGNHGYRPFAFVRDYDVCCRSGSEFILEIAAASIEAASCAATRERRFEGKP